MNYKTYMKVELVEHMISFQLLCNKLLREASHIDFVHEKRHMDVGEGGCHL